MLQGPDRQVTTHARTNAPKTTDNAMQPMKTPVCYGQAVLYGTIWKSPHRLLMPGLECFSHLAGRMAMFEVRTLEPDDCIRIGTEASREVITHLNLVER